RCELRAADGERPVLGTGSPCTRGLRARGDAARSLELDGLVIDGGVRLTGAFTRVVIRDCTLLPRSTPWGERPALVVGADVRSLEIERSIVHGIAIDDRWTVAVRGDEAGVVHAEVLPEPGAARTPVRDDARCDILRKERALDARGPGVALTLATSIVD